ncbi:hypothetical protein HPB50_028674 [Hyalomma asiaticum]|nr:hypothetical protein HPB50_028674 [Hyalomma asiaticum]
MKKAAVQANPGKMKTDQAISSARRAKTGKVATSRPAADVPYSPPCTRSQKQRFEKQVEHQAPLTERRRRSRPPQDSGRSALSNVGNVVLPRNDGASTRKPPAVFAKVASAASSSRDRKSQSSPKQKRKKNT